MVNIENHIGKIIISKKYLMELVEHAVTNCFGVSGVCSVSTFFIAFSALTSKNLDRNKGVEIYTDKNGSLIINLHIKVTYGTNISAVVKSVSHKVRFTVEESIGVTVHEVNVFIDEMSC